VIQFREKISDSLAELETEILVEQKLHIEAVISRLSRSAAYDRQARMSSSVNSGSRRELLVGLTGGEPTEHVRDRDPHMADARPAATLARLDRDDVLVVHDREVSIDPGFSAEGFTGRGYDKLP
jgi:hypothetical protein